MAIYPLRQQRRGIGPQFIKEPKTGGCAVVWRTRTGTWGLCWFTHPLRISVIRIGTKCCLIPIAEFRLFTLIQSTGISDLYPRRCFILTEGLCFRPRLPRGRLPG